MAVPEGRDDLKTTGLIKADYTKLKSYNAEKPELKNISSFSASYNENTSEITFNWAKYPGDTELSALKKESSDMNFFNANGLYGNIVYKARIRVNGTTIKEVSNGTETLSQAVDGLGYDSNVEVCGYYGFEKSNDTSNEMCSAFKTPKKPEPEPVPEPEVPENPQNPDTDPGNSQSQPSAEQ